MSDTPLCNMMSSPRYGLALQSTGTKLRIVCTGDEQGARKSLAWRLHHGPKP